MADLEALVFDVQRFSIHDGPGIRTTVFFKGCPLRCAWCQNPESLRPVPELAFYADRCCHERDCVSECDQGAIGPEGGAPDRDRCLGCGRCEAACAYGARRLVGRRIPIGELLEQVRRDEPFFRASGGGLTISGGEPTLQMEAMGELARRAHASGLSVGVQTCGSFRWSDFAPHLSSFAFVYFDLKAIDAALHRSLTGADNRVILDNARKLAASGTDVLFRTPIVPGHNDGDEDLMRLAVFLREVGASRVHLLCYHAFGRAKLPRISSPLAPLDPRLSERAQGSLEVARAQLSRAGFEVSP